MVIRKQVLAFGKSEKSEFIYIGSFGLSGVTRIWGPISVGPDDIGSDHMYAHNICFYGELKRENEPRYEKNLSYAICKQQSRRSACVSVQSDQRLCWCLDSITSIPAKSKISRLQLNLVSVHMVNHLLCENWKTIPVVNFFSKM